MASMLLTPFAINGSFTQCVCTGHTSVGHYIFIFIYIIYIILYILVDTKVDRKDNSADTIFDAHTPD